MSDKIIKLAAKKFLWSAILFVVLSGRSKDNPRSPPTVLVRRVACKGWLCQPFLPGSSVSRGTLPPGKQALR